MIFILLTFIWIAFCFSGEIPFLYLIDNDDEERVRASVCLPVEAGDKMLLLEANYDGHCIFYSH